MPVAENLASLQREYEQLEATSLEEAQLAEESEKEDGVS